jgi:hypothetical protein
MLTIQGVRCCKKLNLSSMYGQFKNMEVGEMDRRKLANWDRRKPKDLTKLEQLRQRKSEVLKMILHEKNNITRGIYKTQLIHLEVAIEKAENNV